MFEVILLIHVFAAFVIIALVLVQQGKGATMGAAFGSGASSTVFGSRGSGSFLFRLTIGLIIVFFVTSIGLNYLVTQSYKQEKVITLPGIPTQTVNDKEIKVPATTTEQNSSTKTDDSLAGQIPTRK